MPSSQTIVGEQLVQGCYAVACGRFELRPSGCKAQNIPLHHRILMIGNMLLQREIIQSKEIRKSLDSNQYLHDIEVLDSEVFGVY